MRPIQDIADLHIDSVLYHSAFGFARVGSIGQSDVKVVWERPDANLPLSLTRDTLRRVYSLCRDEGFFAQAYRNPEDVRELMQVDPPAGIELLLRDLAGPQTRTDIQDWLISRRVMTQRAFERWWEALLPMINHDTRFVVDQEVVHFLVDAQAAGPLAQLDNPALDPSRRIDLALEHRSTLGDTRFRQEVSFAWRTGGPQVRDLALAALKKYHPQVVLLGLLEPGPDNLDALIHAVRRANWQPDQFDPPVLDGLLARLREAVSEGGPMDSEGRFAAAITRWGCPGSREFLSAVSGLPDGQRLVEATLASLPPRRADEMLQELLDLAIASGQDSSAVFLVDHLVRTTQTEASELGERMLRANYRVGSWILERYSALVNDLGDFSEEPPTTMEIEMEPLDLEPILLGDLPARAGRTVVGLGRAICRAMQPYHARGEVVNPTRGTLALRMNGEVIIHEVGNAQEAPRPRKEEATLKSDVYAAAVLIIEALLGRVWPRNIPADRVTIYLRHVIHDLPPSSMAPIDAALHPNPGSRPADAAAWLELWNACAEVESARLMADLDDRARLGVGFDTHIGAMKILYTQTNQDALYAAVAGPLSLLAVCDGISTANAGSGDVASGISTHVIASLWEQAQTRLTSASDTERREFLDRSLRMANRAVCEAALRFAGGNLAGRVPMGTTAVILVTRGNRVNLAWLGDSRAYLVGPYGASLLTADMNQAGERLVAWHTGLELAWDPSGFALVGYLGHFNEWSRPEALPPRHIEFTLLPGERIIICSDGVTDYIAESHPQVAHILASTVPRGHPVQAARMLTNLANRGGGGDNATVIIATLAAPVDPQGARID